MATDRALARGVAALALCGLSGVAPRPVVAQAPTGPSLLLIGADTRVASVDFAFTAGSTIPESALRPRIGLQAPGGFASVRRALAWLPFVSKPTLAAFAPADIQKDKIRLTRLYQRQGFPRAHVSYRVRLDTTANTVDVTFVIDEGPPLELRDLQAVTSSGASVSLGPDLDPAWRRFTEGLASRTGARLSEAFQARIRAETLDWLRDRGYAFAEVATTVEGDSATTRADLRLRVDAGPRAVVGAVTITGNRHLSEGSVLRELPFRTGEPFRASALNEGQRQLFGLDLVRLALIDVAPDQPRDSTADVQVRINEGSLRVIDGRLGFASQSGVSADVNWRNRDFLGGGRSLRIDATARTGLWAVGESRQVRYGGSVTLRQPYLGDRRVSGLVSPFVEYRDDLLDRSTRAGVDLTVLWQRGALRTMSLGYGFAVRRVGTARGGGLAGVDDLIGLLRAVDTADVDVRSSTLTYAVTWGGVDDVLNPRAGWVARASAEIAGPSPVSTVEYGRLAASYDRFVPLGAGSALVARVAGGRLAPFGRSVPTPGAGDEIPALLRLRDVVFTAGGTDDVRGWASDLLGPKVPDFTVTARGDSVVLRSAGRYVPLGGLARLTASLELRTPMPLVPGPHSVFGFLDAGRIWIPDDRFDPTGGLASIGDRLYAGAGAGLQFGTPAGPLRIAVGYKLNPSPLDLRDPGLVGDALLLGQPIESVPEESGRRWHVHLSIGRPF